MNNFIKTETTAVSAYDAHASALGQRRPPRRAKRSLDVEARVERLLARMTLEEKLDLLGGTGFDTKPNARLGIPALRMTDGPQGVRLEPPADLETPPMAFPCGAALAATWDPELVQHVGRSIAQQARALGKDMLLAPCVNIQRAPQGGRNFETYSEDPHLASRMAVAFIRGVQRQRVIATVKHFAVNNQEFQRKTLNAEVDERVLHEIYFPAFRAAVQEAGVWSVMSAYNKLNGAWCSENAPLLTDVLKTRWRFRGFVVSDWDAVHSAVETANAGLDLEMPTGTFLNRDRLLPALADGRVSMAVIDDKVRRILRAMFSIGLFGRRASRAALIRTPEQQAVALRAATESIVLLKNAGGLLPLLPGQLRSIALIGPNADRARVGGGGSARVPARAQSPLDAIRSRLGESVRLTYALGCPMPGETAASESAPPRGAQISEAADLAEAADVAVVFAGHSDRIESEGFDRESLALPAGQDELIEAVVAANPNTVVVLNVGAPVLMGRWVERVPAVLNAWFGGEQVGPAIAAVLFGDANPSGKLPVTFPKRAQDSPARHYFPDAHGTVRYDEGLYVGYRHYDKRQIEPQFPFGHGLSYTRFEYSDLKVTPQQVLPGQPVRVRLRVRNVGPREGAEVVQLYVRDRHCRLERPVKELKAFRKIALKPGQTRAVAFTLDRSAMAFYDPARHDWVTEPGVFEVLVGASSRDIRLRATFELAHGEELEA
jgi:beta-glucosidase